MRQHPVTHENEMPPVKRTSNLKQTGKRIETTASLKLKLGKAPRVLMGRKTR